jgi:hypothetical protein
VTTADLKTGSNECYIDVPLTVSTPIMQRDEDEKGDCVKSEGDSFHQSLSWQEFHDEMRSTRPLIPRSLSNLDILQPRYPLPPPHAQQLALRQLNTPYTSLSMENINMFRKQRWIRLKQVFPPALLLAARERIITLATAATNGKNISHPDESIFTEGFYPDDVEKYWGLISEPVTQSWNIQMVWAVDPLVRALVCNPRIGECVVLF